MHSFFDLTYFREVGQKYRNIFVRFLVQMKTSKSHFEIIWPLIMSYTRKYEMHIYCLYYWRIKLKHSWFQARNTDAKSLIFAPKFKLNEYLGRGYKGVVFCRNYDWIMEKMDKGITVPKWVLIVQPKVPQMNQNLSAQFVCPSPKVWDFDRKGFFGRP